MTPLPSSGLGRGHPSPVLTKLNWLLSPLLCHGSHMSLHQGHSHFSFQSSGHKNRQPLSPTPQLGVPMKPCCPFLSFLPTALMKFHLYSRKGTNCSVQFNKCIYLSSPSWAAITTHCRPGGLNKEVDFLIDQEPGSPRSRGLTESSW